MWVSFGGWLWIKVWGFTDILWICGWFCSGYAINSVDSSATNLPILFGEASLALGKRITPKPMKQFFRISPEDTWRNNNVIKASKRRCDVVLMLLLRRVSAGWWKSIDTKPQQNEYFVGLPPETPVHIHGTISPWWNLRCCQISPNADNSHPSGSLLPRKSIPRRYSPELGWHIHECPEMNDIGDVMT